MPNIQCNKIDDPNWRKPDQAGFQLKNDLIIWRISLAIPFDYSRAGDFFPDQEEWGKANRYVNEADKRRFVLGKLASRYLLAKYLSVDPFRIRFQAGYNKKPELHRGENAGIHFNLSHSGNWILFAIGKTELGIDIEEVNRKFNYQELLQTCFSDVEIRFIQNSADPVFSFFDFWTRKEALIKALGEGLDQDLPTLPCMDGMNQLNNILPDLSRNWTISRFNFDGPYAASVAHDPEIRSFRFYELSSILF